MAQLEVLLHGRLVATITNAPGDVNVVTIDEDYARDIAAPTLSFRAFRDSATGSYRTATRSTQTVVHPYFANLLPEGPLRDYLAAHGGVKSIRDFPLLRLLGGDLPGAIVLRDPSDEKVGASSDVRGDENDAERNDERPLRFSLAGVQLKFSASGNPERGLTIPVAGMGGDWIVKLPDLRYDRVPENEFSMMSFARAVGIDVPPISLVEAREIAGVPSDVSSRGNAYAIRRFDRTADGGRVHTEDFAQANALYPREKYSRFNYDLLLEQVAASMGAEVALDLIRRIVFTIGIGNGDMHAKNWSVRYLDGRTPSLAPAYDYVSTIVYIPGDDLGMNLSGTKRFTEIDEARVLRLATRARLPRKPVLDAAYDTVARMREIWPRIADSLPLDAVHRATIAEHMDRIPLFAPRGATAAHVSTALRPGA